MEKMALGILSKDATEIGKRSQKKAVMKASSGSRVRAKAKDGPPTASRLPATISLPSVLNKHRSDRQFRRLIRQLLTVARRLETARDYFGCRISVTGPQFNLLMTVAQLQGTAGVSIGSVARAMHVSSSFITAEAGKLSDAGLLTKRPNPSDRRGALLKLAPSGHARICGLLPEIRAVNDLFFGVFTVESFATLCASADALVEGSREAMELISRMQKTGNLL
jgi:DNA-binding MarR family transcriptional regulator